MGQAPHRTLESRRILIDGGARPVFRQTAGRETFSQIGFDRGRSSRKFFDTDFVSTKFVPRPRSHGSDSVDCGDVVTCAATAGLGPAAWFAG